MGRLRAKPQDRRGDLRGAYGGVSARVSVGLGLGANVLLGGSDNTIALQPVSVEGQTGLSVNAGISGLELSDEGRRGEEHAVAELQATSS